MTKNKRILLIAGIIALLACLCVVLVTCSGGQGETPTEPSGTQGTVGTEEITYTIEVTNQGGLYMKQVGIFIYADSSLQDLVWFDRTDDEGKMIFTALESDNYVAVLSELPAGYAAEEYYPLTGAVTKIALSTATMSGDDELPTYELGSMVMDFSVTGPDGTEYTLSELFADKKAVVLNFWYIECQPCRAEFPYLQEAYEKYSDDIAVIGMNPINQDADAIAAFAQEMGITFPLVACGTEWEQIMQLTAYPTTVVIDRYGNICLIHKGSIDNTETFERIFDCFAAEDYEQKLYTSIEELPEIAEEGSVQNPQEIAGKTSFEITVEPGKEVFVDVYRVTGMYMQVTGEDFYVLHDGKTHTSKNGSVGYVITTGDNYTPTTLGFGNKTDKTQTIKVNFSHLKGTYGNPYTLSLGDFTAKVAAGNDQGVYYLYKATADGALMIQYLSGTNGVDYGLTLYNLSTGAYRTLSEDGGENDSGTPTVGVKVSKGDQVQLIVAALPDKDFNYPGGTFNLKAYLGDASELDKDKVPKQDYTITVVDTQGNTVPDVSFSLAVGETPATVKTDGKGIAKINLPIADYVATLTVPAGYTCETTEYTLSKDAPTCTVTLTPVVVVKHDYTVKVADAEEAPLKDVTVILGTAFATTDDTGTAVFAQLEEDTYTVAVVAPAGYVSAAEGYTFPEGQWEMTVKLEREVIDANQYPLTTVRIEPEQEVYYKLDNAGGLVLRFMAEEGYVIYNGQKYTPDANGFVSVELDAGDDQLVIFGNAGDTAKNYYVTTEYPKGSAQNPIVVADLSQLNVVLEAGDADGMYYSWTAGENLEVTLSASSGNAAVTVGSKTVEGSLADGISFEVTKGEKVTVQVTAEPDGQGQYPAADITVTGTQKTPNSASNPELLTDISRVHLVLPEGKAQGYYYKWIATGEGTVTFSFETITQGVNGVIALSVGTKEVTMTGDRVQIDVAENDEVLIRVAALPGMDNTYPAADIVFNGSFVLGNSASNPDILQSIESIAVNLAEGDANGYYYQWTATDTGKVILTLADDADVNVTVSCGSKSASFTDGAVNDDGQLAAILEVAKNDVVSIRVIANDSAYPAVQTTVKGVLQLPNSETNPIDISAYPFTTQNISNGTPVYYRLNDAAGMELIISDADAFVISGDTTYNPVEGKVTVPIISAAQVVAVGNNGSTEKAFSASIGYPLGSKENPQVLTSIESIVTTLAQGDADGYYYSWTVPGNGVATFRISSITGTDVTGDVVLTVGSVSKKLSVDGVYGVLTAELTGGDVVTLQILAEPASATEITVAGELDRNPNSPENPEIISDITAPVDVKLEVGDLDGHYYQWTADGDCTVELSLDDAEGKIVLTSGSKTAENISGKATMALQKGEKLLIQVSFQGAAAEMTLSANVTYDLGTAQNPQIITDIASVAASLEAGDDDGYHYQWINDIADGSVSFTVTGGTVNVYVNGTLAGTADGTDIAVKEGDKVMLQLLAAAQEGTYPAASVSAVGAFAYVAGTELNPIEVTEYPFLTQSIQPSQTCYFRLYNADGRILSLTTGTDGCLIYGDTENYSGVTVTGDAQLIAIRNEGTEASAYRMALTYPLGSEQNPEVITDLTELTVTLDAKTSVYYFKYVALDVGSVSLTQIGTGYTSQMITASATADLVESYYSSLEMTAGEAVLFKVSKTGTEEQVKVTLQGYYEYTKGSKYNPEVLTEFKSKSKKITDTDYYYIWTATGEGTLTVTKNTLRSGVGDIYLYINGEEIGPQNSENKVSAFVIEGETVLIRLVDTSIDGAQTQIYWLPALEEAEGTEANPIVLTESDLSSLSVTLLAGDKTGNYYTFTCPDSVPEGTLHLKETTGAAVTVKLKNGETVANSSDGYVYTKMQAGDVISIQVVADSGDGSYPAATAILTGGIKVPASDPVEEGKVRYTVAVTEVNNFSVTGVTAGFYLSASDIMPVATASVVDGEAYADLASGTYIVKLIDANNAYYFDSRSTAEVTDENRDVQLQVTKIAAVSEGNTLKEQWFMTDSGESWYAYGVTFGATGVVLNTSQPNYSADHGGNCFFLFTPPTAGTYRFKTTDSDAAVSVWSVSAATFLTMDDIYDASTDSVTLPVLESQFANNNQPVYLVGIKCVPSVTETLLIITDLNKVPQDITLMEADTSWYSGYVPTAFSFDLAAGQSVTVTPVDEKTAYTVVYSETDGYYHFDTVDGPIVYVNLDYSALSFQQMINPGGNTGTAFRKFWMEDGVYTKKEDYTDVMTQYLLNACKITQGDTTYQLYPVTADMYHMLYVGGERWWDISYNGGAEYIYKDADNNNRTDVTLDPGWLFACCKAEITD